MSSAAWARKRSDDAPLPLRVGGREMLADIAKPGGAEQGVGDRVEDDVGVAVAGKAARMGHGDAAEHHRAFAGEAVNVEAQAGPRHQTRGKHRLGPGEIAGVVSLSSMGSPSTVATFRPAARATWSRRSADARPALRRRSIRSST